MPRTIPGYVDLHRSQVNAAWLADGLLSAGVVRESDWTGRLEDTLSAGFARWLNADLGLEHLRFFELTFAYTDDLDRSQVDDEAGIGFAAYAEVWARAHAPKRGKRPPGPPTVGALGLFCAADEDCTGPSWGREVIVGTQVQALERLTPGAGYSVLGLLQLVLQPFFAATPWWGERFMKWAGGFLYETEADDFGLDREEDPDRDPDQEDPRDAEGVFTLERYQAAFPDAALGRQWRPEPVRAAREVWRPGDGVELFRALREAETLAGLWFGWNHKRRALNEWDTFENGHEAVPTVVVRWDEGDPLPRVVDDYQQNAWESGNHLVTMVFTRGFLLGHAGSLRDCLAGFRHGMEILASADRLLQHLHQPTTLERILGDRAGELTPAERGVL